MRSNALDRLNSAIARLLRPYRQLALKNKHKNKQTNKQNEKKTENQTTRDIFQAYGIL